MIRMVLALIISVIAGTTAVADETMTLWYRQPADKWVEALALGNGRMGAMVFGSAPRERLQLNEESLWAGEPFDVYPDRFAEHLNHHLDEVAGLQLLLALRGRNLLVHTLCDLIDSDGIGHDSPPSARSGSTA